MPDQGGSPAQRTLTRRLVRSPELMAHPPRRKRTSVGTRHGVSLSVRSRTPTTPCSPRRSKSGPLAWFALLLPPGTWRSSSRLTDDFLDDVAAHGFPGDTGRVEAREPDRRRGTAQTRAHGEPRNPSARHSTNGVCQDTHRPTANDDRQGSRRDLSRAVFNQQDKRCADPRQMAAAREPRARRRDFHRRSATAGVCRPRPTARPCVQLAADRAFPAGEFLKAKRNGEGAVSPTGSRPTAGVGRRSGDDVSIARSNAIMSYKRQLLNRPARWWCSTTGCGKNPTIRRWHRATFFFGG